MATFNPIEHPVCLLAPDRLAHSAWLQHVPFAMLLVDMVRPCTFVELGTYRGVSYCAFCQAVKYLGLETRCHAIDTWAGDEHGGFYSSSVLADLKAHHDVRYEAFSTLVQTSFDDAVGSFADGSIDLLHIDGYHTYEAVHHDFETWLPKMSQQGVILFHDIADRRDDFGVWKLWAELKLHYSQHLEFDHGHGLGLVVVGNVVPEGLRPLLELGSAERIAVRNLFHELGMRIESSYSLQALRQEFELQRERDIAISDELRRQLEESERKLVEAEAQREQAVAERAMTSRQHVAELTAAQRQVQALESLLGSAQSQLSWLESSRGVHAVKLARAARAVLKHKGPLSLSKHVALWMVGKRGYHLRDIDTIVTKKAAKASKSS